MSECHLGDGCRIAESAQLLPPENDQAPARLGDDSVVRAGTIIYPDVIVGSRIQTGHNAVIREETTIGHDVTVGTQVVIDGQTDVGDEVSMQTGVYAPPASSIGDRVFLGPNAVLETLEALGHEVGYHYEDLDRAGGDVQDARRSFGRELERLRRHATVDTVCMHGNPLTPHDNRDMWDDPSELEPYGIDGEAYLSMDFTDVTYFSDTGRTWADGDLKIKDHTMGEGDKQVSASSTAELETLLRTHSVDRACLLTHPNRWADSTPEYVAEATKDAITNVGKRGLTLLR